MSRRLGIFGGTFNPVHNGHLFLADDALFHYQLEQIIFVPNGRPPHKLEPKISAEMRYQMLLAATESCPHFEVSRVELERQGKSFTIDTLNSFSAEDQLFFLCGADAFEATWHRLNDVLERLSGLILANRAGTEFVVPEQLQTLSKAQQVKISKLDFPNIAISSSDIRSRIAEDKPFRFLIPEPVYRIITESDLYRSS